MRTKDQGREWIHSSRIGPKDLHALASVKRFSFICSIWRRQTSVCYLYTCVRISIIHFNYIEEIRTHLRTFWFSRLSSGLILEVAWCRTDFETFSAPPPLHYCNYAAQVHNMHYLLHQGVGGQPHHISESNNKLKTNVYLLYFSIVSSFVFVVLSSRCLPSRTIVRNTQHTCTDDESLQFRSRKTRCKPDTQTQW